VAKQLKYCDWREGTMPSYHIPDDKDEFVPLARLSELVVKVKDGVAAVVGWELLHEIFVAACIHRFLHLDHLDNNDSVLSLVHRLSTSRYQTFAAEHWHMRQISITSRHAAHTAIDQCLLHSRP